MFETTKARKYMRQIEDAAKDSARHSPIFNENRDFVEFEFLFFFHFVYDYRIYHKLKPELRKAIGDIFVDELYNTRKHSISKRDLDELFDNRTKAFFTFMQESKTMGDFIDMASDYMNVLLTISIDENGYANGSLGDLPTIKAAVKPNIFTALIRDALLLHSWTTL